ncbi:hypothetical protein RB195_016444 [Necator americanus]|uniref:Uncharacterized protein n=1 Tax=Necator americanus TaxID=51031 RepID=A0ABR1C2Z9_NECAM
MISVKPASVLTQNRADILVTHLRNNSCTTAVETHELKTILTGNVGMSPLNQKSRQIACPHSDKCPVTTLPLCDAQ